MRIAFQTSQIMLSVLAIGAVTAAVVAGGIYDLTWHTIDCGGGTSTGGGFELAGTIGQHDAGGPMTSGALSVTGGFWVADSGAVSTCPGDLNGDNQVNVFDMLSLLGEWGPCPGCASDLNGDDAVNVFDMLILLGAWGECPQ